MPESHHFPCGRWCWTTCMHSPPLAERLCFTFSWLPLNLPVVFGGLVWAHELSISPWLMSPSMSPSWWGRSWLQMCEAVEGTCEIPPASPRSESRTSSNFWRESGNYHRSQVISPKMSSLTLGFHNVLFVCKSQKDIVKEVAVISSNGPVKWLGKGDTGANKGTEAEAGFSESWSDSQPSSLLLPWCHWSCPPSLLFPVALL